MTTIKPTRDELALIRACATAACRKAGQRLARIEIGLRFSLKPGATIHDASPNILLVDQTPDWEESDLYSTDDWESFRNGVPAAPGGRAVCDFYCYDRDGLCCNIQAKFDAGRLTWCGETGPWGFTHWGPESLQEVRAATS